MPTTMAFEATYREQYVAIYRYCFRLLGSADEARDFTQETFMRLFVTSQQGQNPENPVAWLYRVAGNLCLSHLSQTRQRITLLRHRTALTPIADEPDRQYEQEELISRIRAAMAQLTSKSTLSLLGRKTEYHAHFSR